MTNISDIIEFLQSNHISFDKEVDLKTKTWIKRGGITQLWVQPDEMQNFEKLVGWCQLKKIQAEVIGNTSNSYFLNTYNPTLVISTLKLNKMKVAKDAITCDCGYNMTRFTKHCISHGISGFEGFIGLPGTVGGAAINNAGCYNSLISDVVSDVCIIRNGVKSVLTNKQLNYSHRNSALKSNEINGVVTTVTFNIEHKEDPNILENRAKDFKAHRNSFQEHTYPNLGSIFSTLEFKAPSIIIRITNAIVQRVLNFIISDDVTNQKLRTELFLKLRGAGIIRKYVSKYGIGCFTWNDEFADKAFKEYIDFIHRNTTKAIIEIDIKGV